MQMYKSTGMNFLIAKFIQWYLILKFNFTNFELLLESGASLLSGLRFSGPEFELCSRQNHLDPKQSFIAYSL